MCPVERLSVTCPLVTWRGKRALRCPVEPRTAGHLPNGGGGERGTRLWGTWSPLSLVVQVIGRGHLAAGSKSRFPWSLSLPRVRGGHRTASELFGGSERWSRISAFPLVSGTSGRRGVHTRSPGHPPQGTRKPLFVVGFGARREGMGWGSGVAGCRVLGRENGRTRLREPPTALRASVRWWSRRRCLLTDACVRVDMWTF